MKQAIIVIIILLLWQPLFSLPNISERITPLLSAETPKDLDYKKGNAFIDQAWKYSAKEDMEKALDAFLNAISLIPNNDFYWSSLSNFLFWKNLDYESSEIAARKAYSLNPKPVSLTYIALNTWKLGKQELAIKAFDEALGQFKSENEKRFTPAEKVFTYGMYTYAETSFMNYTHALEIARKAFKEFPETKDWYLIEGAKEAAFMLGHEKLAKRAFAEAAKFYEEGNSYDQKSENYGKNRYYADYQLVAELCKKAVTIKNPENSKKMKIKFLIFPKTEVGEVQNTLTNTMKARARKIFEALGPLFEIISKGKFGLEVDFVELDTKVDSVTQGSFTELGNTSETHGLGLESLSNQLRTLFYADLEKYDGYALFWNGANLSGNGNGGILAFPLVSYTSYSPLRTYIDVPLNSEFTSQTYIYFMHEVFHNIEALIDLKPTHGYRDGVRLAFPDYVGKSELAYYVYVFDTRVQNVDLLFPKNRYPLRNLASLKKIESKMLSIPEAKRKESAALTKEAESQFQENKNIDEALAKLNKAIALNPYNIAAHKALELKYVNMQKAALGFESAKFLADIDNNYWDTLNCANILRDKKQYAEAETYYKRSLGIAETNSERGGVNYAYAENERARGNNGLSISLYKKSLDLIEGKTEWYTKYAKFWLIQLNMLDEKTRDKAVAELGNFAKEGLLEEWHIENIFYEVFWKAKDNEHGREILDIALDSSLAKESKAKFYLSYGRLELNEENIDEALSNFEACTNFAKKTNPEYAESIFWKGFVMGYKQNNFKQGYVFVKKAVDLGYTNDWAKGILADFEKRK